MAEKKENFFKKAFKDMKENAKAQHEVDKANFQAVKAEAKANFEENRGTHTLQRAKETARESWAKAKRTPDEVKADMQAEREKQIAEAQARTKVAEEKYESLKTSRCNKKK